jgi:hypothetical protein
MDDEHAGDPPMVVRQATAADWENYDKATLRRLPVDVIADVVASFGTPNGGESHDD